MIRHQFTSSANGPIRNRLSSKVFVALLATCLCLTAGSSEAAQAVWDGASLAKAPKVFPATERPANGLRSLFYEGADYKGKPTWVFAYYAAPQGTPPAGGWPAVVCAHGGGGTAYPNWVRTWNSHGYAAIAMDL